LRESKIKLKIREQVKWGWMLDTGSRILDTGCWIGGGIHG